MVTLEITNTSLSLSDLAAAVEGPIRINIDHTVFNRIRESHDVLLSHLKAGTKIYGVTTGFGKLSQVKISPEDQVTLQENLIRSHAAGVGNPFPGNIVRLAMLLKLITFARGHSGVSERLVLHLAHFINHDILPIVPEQGSVGASGDLAPLAHIALGLMGEGDVWYHHEKIPASMALERTQGKPYQPGPKEGLSLINGTQISTALAVANVVAARILVNQADEIAALSVEASLSSRNVFAPDIHDLKYHPGQRETARRVYGLLTDSQIVASHADCDRTQDPYSIRCVPHVHGASRDTLAFVEKTVLAEANSVSDNPLILPDGRIISSGHFHAESVAQAMDALSIALSEIGAISERRIHYFMKGIDNRLPPFLTPTPGLESGLMLAHVTATALASENKTLSHPASVDSLPSSGGQEDLVSMAPWAGRKAGMILGNVRKILAIELLTGARAIQLFLTGLKCGKGTGRILQWVQSRVPLPDGEFSPGPVIEKLENLLKTYPELAVGKNNE